MDLLAVEESDLIPDNLEERDDDDLESFAKGRTESELLKNKILLSQVFADNKCTSSNYTTAVYQVWCSKQCDT